MRRLTVILSLGVFLTSCGPGRQASEPPARYQSDSVAVVNFSAEASILCAGGDSEPGVTPEGCALGNQVTLPNPCQWPGQDTYAQLACHELGHVNGWSASHPKS